MPNMKNFVTVLLSFFLVFAVFAPAVGFAQSPGAGAAAGFLLRGGEAATGDTFAFGFNSALRAAGALFLSLGTTFLWFSGVLFNFALKYSILEFAGFANISGISIAWAVLRDIANVFFIFIFLAIGISTILGVQQYDVKKLLPVLLVIAVLVNFSLFFTRVTIDVAHGFAGAILNQSGVVLTECQGNGTDCTITQGVATAFIQQLGVIDIFGKSTETQFDDISGERSSPISTDGTPSSAIGALQFGLIGFIFLSAAAIVFLAGAVMLIMRIVTLLLLMISAAPAFAAYILPSTRPHFNKWLDTLLKEAFFAPILLLLISISLLFLNTARTSIPGLEDQSFADLFIRGELEAGSLVVMFLIALGLLFMSIKVANDMGVSGAKMAMSIQNKAKNFAGQRAGALTAGGLAMAGRNTVGRGAAAAASGLRETKFGRSSLGRLTTQTFDNVGDSSFDGRALADKDLQKTVGKPGKGIVSRVKDRTKAELAYSKDLGLTKEERGVKAELETEFKTKTKAHATALATATSKEDKVKLNADFAKEKASFETKKKEIDQTPQKEYAEKLEKEVVGKIKQKELTGKGVILEKGIAENNKQQDEIKEKIKNTRQKIYSARLDVAKAVDSTEKAKLSGTLKALEDELKDAHDEEEIVKAMAEGLGEEKSTLKTAGEYEARTGEYKAGALGFFGTDATGKLSSSQAINKELKKGDDKKNLDTLIKTLKESSGGDKKDSE